MAPATEAAWLGVCRPTRETVAKLAAPALPRPAKALVQTRLVSCCWTSSSRSKPGTSSSGLKLKPGTSSCGLTRNPAKPIDGADRTIPQVRRGDAHTVRHVSLRRVRIPLRHRIREHSIGPSTCAPRQAVLVDVETRYVVVRSDTKPGHIGAPKEIEHRGNSGWPHRWAGRQRSRSTANAYCFSTCRPGSLRSEKDPRSKPGHETWSCHVSGCHVWTPILPLSFGDGSISPRLLFSSVDHLCGHVAHCSRWREPLFGTGRSGS